MALRSHVIAAAAFGTYSQGEHFYAQSVWQELPDNSLCIIDRAFSSAKLLLGIHDERNNKHWLIRLKSNAQMKTQKSLGPADALVEIAVSSEARRKDPSLPLHYTARAITYQRPGFKPQRVLTSLTDHRRYPAAQGAALYHERWELELAYDEIKTDLLDQRESIRSRSPDGVEQEIWGLLLAYNSVRTYMERVAIMAKLSSLRISFVTALRFIREEWYFDSIPGFAPGSLPRHIRRLAEQMSRFILPERRARPSSPRAVKIKMSNYSRKRRPAP
jgi:Transposase DDE domain